MRRALISENPESECKLTDPLNDSWARLMPQTTLLVGFIHSSGFVPLLKEWPIFLADLSSRSGYTARYRDYLRASDIFQD